MAHELTIRENNVAEMAFVGDTPWHGLGQKLDPNADIDAWRVAAGMDWTIEQAPVQYLGTETFAGQNVLYRSDTKAPLSMVSDRYKIVQPADVLEFFRDLMDQNGFKLHTAGTLFGGKRMWALADTGKFAEISKGDGIGGFLLLSTSADRKLATTARFTTVRVVCNNTLSMAEGKNRHMVKLPHSRVFNASVLKDELNKEVNTFGAFIEMGKALRKQKMNMDEAKRFVANLLMIPEGEPDRASAKIIDLFSNTAAGIQMAGLTRWGMLNAVTEYLDHEVPTRTADARLNSTWFGRGDRMKSRALELLAA
jgi:phage/plasmid-like protein (TIGR03299 family)